MKIHTRLFLGLILLVESHLGFAQVSSLDKSEKVANGLIIRYRDTADLCTGDSLTLLPPKIQMSRAGMKSDQRARLDEFVKIVHEEVGTAMKASAAEQGPGGRRRNIEVRLVDFREQNRTLNVATTLAGGAAIDPGKYRIELALLEADSENELAHAFIDSTPTVRGLLLGNAFSRQSTIRRNIRGQIKKLKSYWEKRQQQCQSGAPR
jgi:hypothetical protein